MSVTIDIRNIPAVNAELAMLAERYRTKGQVRKIIRPAAKDFKSGWQKDISAGSGVWLYKYEYGGRKLKYGGRKIQGVRVRRGNLSRSIKIMTFSRSLALFVGPRIKSSGGRRMADGFYYGFQDKGTAKTGWGRGIAAKNITDKVMMRRGSKAGRMMAHALWSDLKYFA